jgi:prolyl-tRNA synthetase
VKSKTEFFFVLPTGPLEIVHCQACQYTERLGLAKFKKMSPPPEPELPLEKLSTPDCSTIESLANFLQVPREKTAKALMYTRIADSRFVFIVIRGDMQLSEEKLAHLTGPVRAATGEEILKSGAVPGYASPIGLRDALILADDLIPQSQNLAAGANEAGFHFKNSNFPRDYTAGIVADLAQAASGDSCIECGSPLAIHSALSLAADSDFNFGNILLALAETHRDDKGLCLPKFAGPFDVYLMHVPGKQIDTAAKAGEIFNQLQSRGISTLFDDRDERAGVKFNDADLIGCPFRITVGEKTLQNGMVELKPRLEKENQIIPLEDLISHLGTLLQIKSTQ